MTAEFRPEYAEAVLIAELTRILELHSGILTGELIAGVLAAQLAQSRIANPIILLRKLELILGEVSREIARVSTQGYPGFDPLPDWYIPSQVLVAFGEGATMPRGQKKEES